MNLRISNKTLIFSRGNIFIFNLNDKCYWQLTEVSIDDIKVIKFLQPAGASKNNLLIGNKSGFIYEIEISELFKFS